MKLTPRTALALLRKAIEDGTVRVTVHASQQVKAAGFEPADVIPAELAVAAARGTVGRNDSNPRCALAYGHFLTLSFGRDAAGVVVVTAWIQER